MSRLPRLLLILVTLYILVSCVPIEASYQPQPTAGEVLAPSPTVGVTLEPTATMTLPAPEIPAKVQQQCSTMSQQGAPNLWSMGSILYYWNGPESTGKTNIEILSPKSTRPQTLVKDAWLGTFRLSPSATQLAWDPLSPESQTRELIVYDITTGQEQHFPWEKDWTSTSSWGWESDTSLRLRENLVSSADGTTVNENLVFEINSQTSTVVKVIQPGLPDLDEDPTPFASFKVTDPKSSRTMYTVFRAGLGWGVALRDLVNDIELWRVYGQSPGQYSDPQWTDDSSRVLISLIPEGRHKPELYSISRDGKQVTQLTALAETNQNYQVRSTSWSPDGQHIAFWLYDLSITPLPLAKLLILDLVKARLIDPCFQGLPAANPGIWLPDNNSFLFQLDVKDQTMFALYNLATGESQVVAQGNSQETGPQLIGWTNFEIH